MDPVELAHQKRRKLLAAGAGANLKTAREEDIRSWSAMAKAAGATPEELRQFEHLLRTHPGADDAWAQEMINRLDARRKEQERAQKYMPSPAHMTALEAQAARLFPVPEAIRRARYNPPQTQAWLDRQMRLRQAHVAHGVEAHRRGMEEKERLALQSQARQEEARLKEREARVRDVQREVWKDPNFAGKSDAEKIAEAKRRVRALEEIHGRK
jgi:hypothetical protein